MMPTITTTKKTNPIPETNRLTNWLNRKDINIDKIAKTAIKEPELLTQAIAGMAADTARIKFTSQKIIRLISETKPEILYPYFETFKKQFYSENTILKWGAILIIGNLATVDTKNQIDNFLDEYLNPIPGPVLVTAANIIGGATQIALAKPHLTQKIVTEISKTERAKYKTAECRNIALGKAIESFGKLYNQIENKKPIIKFVNKQINNSRPATAKKAAAFLKKYAAA